MVDFAKLSESRKRKSLLNITKRPPIIVNSEQQAAIDFLRYQDGHLSLVALAGTGKTTTLIQMLKYAEGDIFFGAFGTDAADEIKARVSEEIGLRTNVRISTIHSMGMSALNWNFGKIKIDINKGKLRAMIDHMALKSAFCRRYGSVLIRMVDLGKQAGFGCGPGMPEIHDLDAWMSLCQHFSIGGNISATADWDAICEYAGELYTRSMRACREVVEPFTRPTVDFSDMPSAPLYYNCRFYPQDFVFLDEAQDSNAVRRENVIRSLKPNYGRLIAVGDPHQAIYGFTGADSKAMDILAERLDSHQLKLTMTYRNTKRIVAAAKYWAPDMQARPDAPEGTDPRSVFMIKRKPKDPSFWDEKLTPGDAILCRNTRPLIELARECIVRHIEIKVKGRDIGLGLNALIRSFNEPLLIHLEPLVREWGLKQYGHWMAAGREMKAQSCLDDSDSIAAFINIAQLFNHTKTEELCTIIDNLFVDTKPRDQVCPVLSTIHKAKGLEWDRVFILGMERYQPSKWAKQAHEIEQENNLCYVAITRPRTELVHIVVPAEKKRRTQPGEWKTEDGRSET